ncbi:unnamed protein product [Lampetra fluviatilis]
MPSKTSSLQQLRFPELRAPAPTTCFSRLQNVWPLQPCCLPRRAGWTSPAAAYLFERMTAATSTGCQDTLPAAVMTEATGAPDLPAISRALHSFSISGDRPAPQQQPLTSKVEDAPKLRRLPPVRQFTAAGGDWTAFRRRFEATYISVGWTSREGLQALPMALDDDSLAAFFAIPELDRATVTRTYTEMAAIFDPPSNVQRRFRLRRWGENQTPLAYHSALLASGHAAFPLMDRVTLDSLALERLLSLAQELGIILAVTEEDDLTSLQVAHGIQAHFNLKEWPAVAASAMEPAVDKQACASFARGTEGRSAGLPPSTREWRPRLSQPPGRPYRTKCARATFASTATTGPEGSRCMHPSSGFNTSSSRNIQASPDASEIRPFLSHHPSSIGRVQTHPVESYPVATQKQGAGSLTCWPRGVEQ